MLATICRWAHGLGLSASRQSAYRSIRSAVCQSVCYTRSTTFRFGNGGVNLLTSNRIPTPPCNSNAASRSGALLSRSASVGLLCIKQDIPCSASDCTIHRRRLHRRFCRRWRLGRISGAAVFVCPVEWVGHRILLRLRNAARSALQTRVQRSCACSRCPLLQVKEH